MKKVLLLMVLAFMLALGTVQEKASMNDDEDCFTFQGFFDENMNGIYAIIKGYIYSVDYTETKIFDARDPERIHFVNRIDIVHEYEFQANHLVVYEPAGEGKTRLDIYDVTDPRYPAYQGSTDAYDDLDNMASYGNFLFVTAGQNGIFVFDISDPYHPREVYQFLDGQNPRYMLVHDHYLIVAAGNDPLFKSIVFYDIADPSHPVEAGEFLPDIREFGYTYSLSGGYVSIGLVGTSGNYLIFGASYSQGCGTSFSCTEIIDISDPATPVVVGPFDLRRSFFFFDRYVLCTTYPDSIQIYDIINPLDPKLVSDFDIPLPSAVQQFWSFGTSIDDLYLNGHTLYVYMNHIGLIVMDISDLTDPYKTGEYLKIPGTERFGFDASGTVAVVAKGLAGVEILDVSDPVHPRKIKDYRKAGYYIYDAVIREPYLYVYDANAGLRILDIQDVYHPVEVGQTSLGLVEEQGLDQYSIPQIVLKYPYIYLKLNYGYLGNRDRIKVINVQNPSNPVVVHDFYPQTAGLPITDIFIFDDRLFVGIRQDYKKHIIEVVDITDPLTMSVQAVLDIPVETTTDVIRVDYNYIFLVNPFTIINISDLTHPLITFYDTDYTVFGFTFHTFLELYGSYAYLGNYSHHRIDVVDVSVRADPVVVKEVNNVLGWSSLVTEDAIYLGSDRFSIYKNCPYFSDPGGPGGDGNGGSSKGHNGNGCW